MLPFFFGYTTEWNKWEKRNKRGRLPETDIDRKRTLQAKTAELKQIHTRHRMRAKEKERRPGKHIKYKTEPDK